VLHRLTTGAAQNAFTRKRFVLPSTPGNMKMTKSQAAGLAKLIATPSFKVEMIHGEQMIRTGVCTPVLHALRRLGHIECKAVYLRGNVTPDFKLITKEI
jgi:hypothetical protein